MEHKGWHSRGYLPHFDVPEIIQGITYRLWDALPSEVVVRIADDAKLMGDAEQRARMEEYLNAGYGACYLRDPRIARLIVENWLRFDGKRYRLIAWVVMPNHIHVLIEVLPGYPLGQTIHSWKSYTASAANRLLQRSGKFWHVDYFDRFIRDEQHFANAVRYIHDNPVKAGLVESAEEWEFSSAKRWDADC